jgi:gamma-glutamyltranspeptidase/glutathione hydrolase
MLDRNGCATEMIRRRKRAKENAQREICKTADMKKRLTIVWAWMALAIALPVHAQDVTAPAPEAATGVASKALSVAHKHMVVAAHPLAAQAGREMLRAGGSAIDAAIAVQMVLGLVEPQSSGLGGGAFIVAWDDASKQVTTIDARETAPAAAKPDRFLIGGKPMAFEQAVLSGLSVGVPGALRGLELAHKTSGKLAWAKLFEPAIRLAEEGFPVGARLNAMLTAEGPQKFAPEARAYFFDDVGIARPVGYPLKNPAYAATLRTIADKGAAAFYEGEIAGAIASATQTAATIKGDLTAADLKSYEAKERPPICFTYRAHKICGMGPPSSGTLTIGQTLKIIEPFASIQGPGAAMTIGALHAIAEAEKLSFADRNRYIADPDFVPQPSGLLDNGYLEERRKLIDPAHAMPKAEPGIPPGLPKRAGLDATHEAAGTSHISIVDDNGNAVSMTTTIESAFGSHLWARGFLLNNEMTDFSFRAIDNEGNAIANAVAPGKRPRSSMAPLLVFDADGKLKIVTGSPGGSRIILFMVKTLVAMLDWGMDAEQAAALVNFGSQGGPFEMETGAQGFLAAEALKGLSHPVKVDEMTSGTHTIVMHDSLIEGGADPRREGAALGD